MYPCTDIDTSLAPGKLRDKKHREHSSRGAIQAFLGLANSWELTVDQRCVLLGEISKQTYHNWQSGKIGVLSRDQLERISLVKDIDRNLHLLFFDRAAARAWLFASNQSQPFRGRSPLCYALQGSIVDLHAIRDHLKSQIMR